MHFTLNSIHEVILMSTVHALYATTNHFLSNTLTHTYTHPHTHKLSLSLYIYIYIYIAFFFKYHFFKFFIFIILVFICLVHRGPFVFVHVQCPRGNIYSSLYSLIWRDLQEIKLKQNRNRIIETRIKISRTELRYLSRIFKQSFSMIRTCKFPFT